jgi:hypothetical protein
LDYLAINFVVVVGFASMVSLIGLVAGILAGIVVVVAVAGIAAVVVAIDCFYFAVTNPDFLVDFLGFPKKLTPLTNFPILLGDYYPIHLADYSNLLFNIEELVDYFVGKMCSPNYSTPLGFGFGFDFGFDFVNYYWFVVQFVQ